MRLAGDPMKLVHVQGRAQSEQSSTRHLEASVIFRRHRTRAARFVRTRFASNIGKGLKDRINSRGFELAGQTSEETV
jgi:hypothetical protein